MEIGEKLLETISSSSIGKLYKSENIYINEVEFLGKRFLINGELENLKWSIDRTKTKEILGYSCVKATTKVIRTVEDKTYEDIIECFF